MEYPMRLTLIYMSRNYKFKNQDCPHFVTFTIVNWIDVFTRDCYRECLIDSLNYCQKNKGLIIYAWCFMTNHIHLIIGTKDKAMQDIVRDFKAFTSRSMKNLINDHSQESRKKWLLWMFTNAGKKNKNNKDWQLWQQHSHLIELPSNFLRDQKLDYIHNNPVKAGFVKTPEDWIWSSAIDYMDQKGLLDIEHIQ